MTSLEQLKSGELAGSTHFAFSDSLQEFPRELFALEESLEVLDLSKNELSSLPADFGRFSKLKIAFFSDNHFEELPRVLGDCPQLGIVAFRSNRIRTIPENALPTSVHWLTLTNNCIEKLPESIGNCVALRKVALSGNKIRSLPDSMQNCRNLELFRVSANNLQEIPLWLLQLPRLRWLAYSGNPCAHNPKSPQELQSYSWDSFELKELLGQGASGHISRAVLDGSEEVAVKLFKGEVTSDGYPKDEMGACIAAGSHPHLVPLKGKIASHPEGKEGVVMGLMPKRYAVLGNPPSLASCTRDQFPLERTLSREIADAIYASVKSAMDHLHSRGILHGDLYAHNTFFDESGHAILGDFGAATFFDTDHAHAEHLKELDRRALQVLREDLLSLSGGMEVSAL